MPHCRLCGAGVHKMVKIRDSDAPGHYRRTAANMDWVDGHGPATRRLTEYYGEVRPLWAILQILKRFTTS